MRASAAATVAAGLAATCASFLAVPAGATLPAKDDKFCEIVYGGKGAAGIDFEGFSRKEAAYAARLFRKLAATGVPAKLEKDLRKLAKIDQRVADGEPAGTVLVAEQKVVNSALTRFSKYVSANCSPPVPST